MHTLINIYGYGSGSPVFYAMVGYIFYYKVLEIRKINPEVGNERENSVIK